MTNQTRKPKARRIPISDRNIPPSPGRLPGPKSALARELYFLSKVLINRLQPSEYLYVIEKFISIFPNGGNQDHICAREVFAVKNNKTDYGSIDVFHESKDCGIYLLHISPETAIKPHLHKTAEVFDLPLSSGLTVQKGELVRGMGLNWKPGIVRTWQNHSKIPGIILSIVIPPYDDEDDFITPGRNIEPITPQMTILIPKKL